MARRRRSRIRYLGRHFKIKWKFFLVLAVLALVLGKTANVVGSSEFQQRGIQSLLRQHFYNNFGRDIPLSVTGGNTSDGFSVYLEYQKLEADGTMSRRGTLEGRLFDPSDTAEFRGNTRESFNTSGDSGNRDIVINGNMAVIRVRP